MRRKATSLSYRPPLRRPTLCLRASPEGTSESDRDLQIETVAALVGGRSSPSGRGSDEHRHLATTRPPSFADRNGRFLSKYHTHGRNRSETRNRGGRFVHRSTQTQPFGAVLKTPNRPGVALPSS